MQLTQLSILHLRMRTLRAPHFPYSKMAELGSEEAGEGVLGDIYLQLSAVGIVVLLVLLVLICVSWSYYRSTISTVFDSKCNY